MKTSRSSHSHSCFLAHPACLWHALVAFAGLTLGPQPAQAAVTEAWVQRYNNKGVSNSDDAATKVVRDAAGDIIVTGSTDDGISGPDMLTIKYSGADGTVLWQKRYNGPANGPDYAYALAVDGSGNVVVTGYSESFSSGNYYTAKYAAADGALLWEQRTSGEAAAVAVDGSGNVVVTGSSNNGSYALMVGLERYGADYYTAKYAAADGALLWEQRYNGPVNGEDRANAVAVDGSGNVVVTGSSNNGSYALRAGLEYLGADYYTAKYAAADGALLWEKRYNGPANNLDRANAVAVDGSGNVVVTGYSNNANNSYSYTAKYAAADGALLWEKRSSNGEPRAIALDGSGNVVVTGSSASKYAAADGALLWEYRATTPLWAEAVALDGSGNVVVTGFPRNNNGGDDYYTAKYTAADGGLLWEKRGPSGDAAAVALDGSGNVVVTGYSSNDSPNYARDYYTAKYAAANGELLWEQRYNGSANSADVATAVAVDASGSVAVTGYSHNERGLTDYYTARYAVADGALLWEQRYGGLHGPGWGVGRANTVAVDGSGNVIVTGESWGANYYYTAKYAAVDGALLWEKRSSGSAVGVAVDGSGNVVVTGSSGNDPNFYYYTAKYAAVDGGLLWEKRGPSGDAAAVALDGSGNVVVTGSSSNGTNDDYYTAKYAAADGALLWEQRYNGPTNGFDWANAVAVDGSDNALVTGYSDGYYYTAKYAPVDGALLWEQRSQSSGEAKAIALDSSGNVVVTGSSTAKYAAADGALLWEQRTSRGEAAAVAVDGSGNVVVTGSSSNGTNSDYYTAKYAAADGGLVWEKRYSGPANREDYAHAVAVDGSGNVVVTGQSQSTIDRYDYYTAKYAAADGVLLWEQRYQSPVNNYSGAQAVAVDGSDNVVVTGYLLNRNERGGSDYYTAKYAVADGALRWEQRSLEPTLYGDRGGGRANAVAVDGSGNVVVTGESIQLNWDANDYYTAKYAAADGALLWEQRYGDSAGYEYDRGLADEALAMAVDAGGNVVVTGSSGTYPNRYYNTVKYAAVDGAGLWSKRGPSGGAAAVAVDSSGNVIVTGSSKGDYYTAKYAAANGAQLWEQRYNGPANSDDQAQALAVDTGGNVLVTGSSNGNFYTAKYAAADGALLWEKRSNSGDSANAVAVDTSGNVVVTGSSYTGSKTGYYTAKYAAADGGLLWEQRYQSPGNNYSGARAVAVDESGNVVVTGISDNGTNTDYYTAKYAAADGALLWEKRYNGPANGNETVLTSHSLALGPNGMVAVTGSSSGDYATVVYRENLPPISIDLVPTGVRLSFTGTPGLSYKIERAPAVTGPWTVLNTLTAPASGLVEYLDAFQPPGQVFYRTVQP